MQWLSAGEFHFLCPLSPCAWVPAPARRTWSRLDWLAPVDDLGQRVWAGEDGTGQCAVTGWIGRQRETNMWFQYKGRCVLSRTSVTPGAVVEVTNIYLPALPSQRAYLPRPRAALPGPASPTAPAHPALLGISRKSLATGPCLSLPFWPFSLLLDFLLYFSLSMKKLKKFSHLAN